MEAFKYHVYICTQQKPDGIPCCCANGSEKVLAAMRREVADRGLADTVQITTSGSIGLCNSGPNMIVYPEGVWYSGVTIGDVPEIVQSHFAAGQPVERLMRTDLDALRQEIDSNKAKMIAGMKAKEEAGMLPDDIVEDIRSFWTSRMLLTAIELDIFTAVAKGGDVKKVAAQINASERGTEMMLNVLTAYSLLEKKNGTYVNGPIAERYLVEGGPSDSRISLMHQVALWNRWNSLTECVREGTSVTYEGRMEDRDSKWTEAFIAAMHKSAGFRAGQVVNALDASKFTRMLDVGGGSGAYSIAFARANPSLHAEVFDTESVTPIARRHIDAAGVADRVSTRSGDLHTDKLGAGFDLVFISAIYHMLSPDDCLELSQKAYETLTPGGTIVLQDFILNPEKTAPFTGALFALNMLVATKAGNSYSISEYTDWLTEAGFQNVRHVPLAGPTGLVVAQCPEVK